MEFKQRFRRILLGLLGLFLLMFFFRLIYGFISYPRDSEYRELNGITNSFTGDTKWSNIASSKYKFKKSNRPNAQITQIDQKYEKTANITCKTDDFEKDEQEIRQTIEQNNAIIQYQQKSGNEGNRKLSLQIGVPPLKFDTFVEDIKKNQKIQAVSITKKDKTNEYRELNAKLASLKKTRESLSELKSKGGKIEEFIQLENRILEIDEKLQDLGVQLGNFDSENEFCTVKLSLNEGKVEKISLTQRIKVALEWTIEYYLLLIFGLILALICAYISVLLIDKFNVLSKFR